MSDVARGNPGLNGVPWETVPTAYQLVTADLNAERRKPTFHLGAPPVMLPSGSTPRGHTDGATCLF